MIQTRRLFAVLVCSAAAFAQAPAELADQLTGRKPGPERNAAERAAAFARVIESTVPGLSADDANAKSQAQALLERVVFYAGRPGGEADRQAAVAALLPLAAKPGARFCRQQLLLELRLLGRAEAVPGLTALLADGDEVVAQSARMALESNPTPEATKALLGALDQAAGEQRIAFVNALGHRREASAVAPLTKLIADPQAGSAALAALAQIATPAAVDALAKARQGAAGAAADNALLVAAGRLLDQGDSARAAKVFDGLYQSDASLDVRLAGLRGWALASGETALPALLAVLDKETPEARVAARVARDLPGGKVAAAYGDRLPALPEAVQIALCGALQERGDKAAVPGLRALASNADAPAAGRAAAITALGTLGGVAEVELLLPVESDPDPVGSATRTALARLGGPEVTTFLLKQLAAGDAARRGQVIRLLRWHRGPATTAALLELALNGIERPARASALKALGELGGGDDFAKLLAALPKLAADGLGGEAAAAAKLLQSQQGAAQATAEPVLAALGQATGDARPPLFALLGPTGAPAAREVLLKALQDGPDADRAAAVAALGEWPDGTPLDPALQVVAAGQAGADGRAATAALRHLASLAGRDDAVVVDAVEQALGKVPAEARFSYLSGLALVPQRRVLAILRGALEQVPQAGRALVDACEVLAGAYRADVLAALDDASKVRDGQFKPAADRVRGMIGRWTDYITAWQMAPPFIPSGWDMGRLFREKAPAEADPDKSTWSIVPGGLLSDQGIVDLDLADFFGDNRALVLRTVITSDAAKDARLELGSDDSITVYLNGKVVHAHDVGRPHDYGQDKADISLQAGRNPVLVKLVNGGGNWKMSIRVRARDGGAIGGLTYGVE